MRYFHAVKEASGFVRVLLWATFVMCQLK